MTADSLVRRLRALPSIEMRRAVLREVVMKSEPTACAVLLEELVRRGRRAGPYSHVALVALADLLEEGELPYALRGDLYEAARAQELPLLSQLLLSERNGREDSDRIEPAAASGERPLTLGERKALARGPRNEMLARLMRDPSPKVMRVLLANPRLTEGDVVRIASMRPQSAATLREVHRSHRWITRPAVRRALCFNPHTPAEVVKRLLPLLDRNDLEEFLTAPGSESLERLAKRMLEERLGAVP